MELFQEIDIQSSWEVGQALRFKAGVTFQMLEDDSIASLGEYLNHPAPFTVLSKGWKPWQDTFQAEVRVAGRMQPKLINRLFLEPA